MDEPNTMLTTDITTGTEEPPQPKQHVMWFDPHAPHGPTVTCTCGPSKTHKRNKVLATWATKHQLKTGHKFRKLK